MEKLEKGKLYQVRHWSDGWILAEYMSKIEAHTATGYRSSDGAAKWHEPARHNWTRIGDGYNVFSIRDKGIQVRPASDESVAEVARLRTNVETKKAELRQALKELREFCA